mgnify:FL=1
MKRRWIVLLLLFMTIGAAGYGFAREEAQKVQKTSSLKIQAVYLECESEEANPLLEDAVLEVNRAVEEHFSKMQEATDYVEAYHNLHVYTKEGKDADTYVTFVTYDMKIRGIYTEVPGLATFYVKKEKDKMQVISDPKESDVQRYIARLTKHQDVQNLFRKVNEEYNGALQSDALLREALSELQNAYGSTEDNG